MPQSLEIRFSFLLFLFFFWFSAVAFRLVYPKVLKSLVFLFFWFLPWSYVVLWAFWFLDVALRLPY